MIKDVMCPEGLITLTTLITGAFNMGYEQMLVEKIVVMPEFKSAAKFYLKYFFPAMWAVLFLFSMVYTCMNVIPSFTFVLRLLINTAIVTLVLSLIPFILWYFEERRKKWEIDNSGIKISILGKKDFFIEWVNIRNVVFRTHGFSLLITTPPHYSSIAFIPPNILNVVKDKYFIIRNPHFGKKG